MPVNGISVAEAARKLGIGIGYVYSLVWEGKLSAQKIDGVWRISEDSLKLRLKKKADSQ